MTEAAAKTSLCKQPRADVDQPKVEVYDLRRTCVACPSQWEGRIGDHGSIYIRYRWGNLTVRTSETDGNAAAASSCFLEDDIGRRSGDRLGGYMETDEMRRALGSV
jgi:hypothetical protein